MHRDVLVVRLVVHTKIIKKETSLFDDKAQGY